MNKSKKEKDNWLQRFFCMHGIQSSIYIYLIYVIIFSVLCSFGGNLCKINGNADETGMTYLVSAIAYLLAIVIVVLPTLKQINIMSDIRRQGTKGLREGIVAGIATIIVMLVAIVFLLVRDTSWTSLSMLEFFFIILCSLGAGIGEELLMRGGVLNILLNSFGRSKSGEIKAVLISSILYDILHFSNLIGNVKIQNVANISIEFAYSTMCSLVFAVIYLKFRNIWSVVVIHSFLIILYTLYELSDGINNKSVILQLNGGAIAMFGASVIMLFFAVAVAVKRYSEKNKDKLVV